MSRNASDTGMKDCFNADGTLHTLKTSHGELSLRIVGVLFCRLNCCCSDAATICGSQIENFTHQCCKALFQQLLTVKGSVFPFCDCHSCIVRVV